MPKGMVLSLVSQVHCMTHLGHDKLKNLIWNSIFWSPPSLLYVERNSKITMPGLRLTLSRVLRPKPTGIQLKATLPFEYLEVDFIEMKYYHHFHYLLVLLCTFL